MAKVLITDAVHNSIIKAIQKLEYDIDYIPRMPYEALGPIIHQYEGIIINSKIIMNKQMIDKAEKLTFIGRLGSGLDIIDLPYAAEKKIEVISAPEGNSNAVAEHALGMLLGLINNLYRADQEVRNFQWNREKNRGIELKGRKIGIIGFGHTGPAFAEKLSGFGVNVFAYDKYKEGYATSYSFVKESSIEYIQDHCEIISIHLPLTGETRFMINASFFNKCKKAPIIINTSRGKILSIKDLIDALNSKTIRGACLDVLENEKPKTYTEEEKAMYGALFSLENVVFSPHIAGWTKESKKKIASTLIQKINRHHKDRKS
jgi:D-3-phosphoglycerate dehydrogenase